MSKEKDDMDLKSLYSKVAKKLIETGSSIAVAESCTGGLIAKLLTDNPGISKVFWGGVVAYSNEAKMSLLSVPEKTLEEPGAVSHQIAESMSLGIRYRAGTDIGLAVTGIAGPDGGTENKPVGLVFVSIATSDFIDTGSYELEGDREQVRRAAASKAASMILELFQPGPNGNL